MKLKRFEEFINESIDTNLSKLYDIARGVDYGKFLSKTDSLTNYYFMLYRGGYDEHDLKDVFATDWIGHAREYGNGEDDDVYGIIVDEKDILFFDDNTFNKMEREYKNMSKSELETIYESYFKRGKLFGAMDYDEFEENDVIDFVYDFVIENGELYSKIQQTKKNDFLIPIMQYYAKSKGKNIVSFLGSDFGGQNEFVVDDMKKYTSLMDIWKEANK